MNREPWPGGGWVAFEPDFLGEEEARACFARLLEEVPWERKAIQIMGREVLQPRWVSWHGDPGCSYLYSGVRNEPRAWTPTLAALRARAEERVGVALNSVLANRYDDGSHSMGFHADKEPELGPAAPDDVVVASVSLGDARRFVLKRNRGGERREFALGGGSLLVMGGSLQQHWKHGVPKTQRVVGPRINLTYRQIRAPLEE